MALLSPALRRGCAATLSAAAITLGVFTGACTKEVPASRFELGKPAFKLNPESVVELSVSQNDPATGTRWSARFEKSSGHWRITSGPEGVSLTDRLADSGFILHLLDTLKTLRVSSRIETSGSDLRSRLGLAPPTWWLRWRESSSSVSDEISLGSHPDPFRVNAESTGEFVTVEGAALKMLEHIRDFRTLRHHKLMTWTLDDADRIEIRWSDSKGSRQLQAERISAEWAVPGGARLSDPAQIQIERLSMLEIAQFEEAGFDRPWVTVIWKNRHNEELRIEIDSLLRARSSGRPGAIFRLPEEARATLLPRHFGIRTRQ